MRCLLPVKRGCPIDAVAPDQSFEHVTLDRAKEWHHVIIYCIESPALFWILRNGDEYSGALERLMNYMQYVTVQSAEL